MNKETVLSLRTTQDFKAAVDAAAEKAGMKTSAYIREAIRDKLYGKRPREK